jgi:hypothetical protein
MSFDSRDLTIALFPVRNAQPGLQMCAQATAGDMDEEEEEEEELECAQATAGDSGYARTDGLMLLRQQLRQTLDSQEAV